MLKTSQFLVTSILYGYHYGFGKFSHFILNLLFIKCLQCKLKKFVPFIINLHLARSQYDLAAISKRMLVIHGDLEMGLSLRQKGLNPHLVRAMPESWTRHNDILYVEYSNK